MQKVMTIMSAKNFSGKMSIRGTGGRGNDIRGTDIREKVAHPRKQSFEILKMSSFRAWNILDEEFLYLSEHYFLNFSKREIFLEQYISNFSERDSVNLSACPSLLQMREIPSLPGGSEAIIPSISIGGGFSEKIF